MSAASEASRRQHTIADVYREIAAYTEGNRQVGLREMGSARLIHHWWGDLAQRVGRTSGEEWVLR